MSSRHPAPGAEWPGVTHVRVKGWKDEGSGGGQETSNYVGVFSPQRRSVTWQSHLLCVKQRSAEALLEGYRAWSWKGSGWRGSAEGKRTVVTVVRSPPPPLLFLTTTTRRRRRERRRRRRKKKRKTQQGRNGNVRTLTIPGYFHLIPSFRRQRR